MYENPFFDVLDRSLRGKYTRVLSSNGEIYEGFVDRMHHQQGGVVLHNVTEVNSDDEQRSGSAYIRNVDSIVETPIPPQVTMSGYHTLRPKKLVELIQVSAIVDSPYLDADFNLVDEHIRSAYRNQFTGSFPVVRDTAPMVDKDTGYELINGHKRIEACRIAGLEAHPCEVITCTDEQAKELVELAHPK